MRINRRELVAAFAVAATASAGIAQDVNEVDITDAEGRLLPTSRIPVEISSEFARTPGALFKGPAAPDVFLTEFFDFNCPFCRKAAGELDALVTQDHDLRLIILHNPILSPDSVEAAKIALAVYSLKGAEAGYRFNRALLAAPGVMNGARAMAAAQNAGFASDEIRKRAQDQRIAATVARHMQLAASAGFSGTPSFEVKGVGIVGYPGDAALRKIVASVRSCDRVAC